MIPEVLETQPELSEVITKTYCTMCEIVEEHGGDVVRLTGDSLLALWALPQPSDPDARWPGRAGELGDEEEIELREAVRAAAACALALQNELEDRAWLSPAARGAQAGSDAGVVFAPTADAASAADAARAAARHVAPARESEDGRTAKGGAPLDGGGAPRPSRMGVAPSDGGF